MFNFFLLCIYKHEEFFFLNFSGIGLTICERLLTLHNDLELCLLCRNVTRAEAAKDALLISHPNSTISIIVMDTSDVKSVFKAAKILKER
jgi:17beta-estradiol 17-dehydrogenase/3beta-hydroxysteroid 3-dehydrogenase